MSVRFFYLVIGNADKARPLLEDQGFRPDVSSVEGNSLHEFVETAYTSDFHQTLVNVSNMTGSEIKVVVHGASPEDREVMTIFPKRYNKGGMRRAMNLAHDAINDMERQIEEVLNDRDRKELQLRISLMRQTMNRIRLP